MKKLKRRLKQFIRFTRDIQQGFVFRWVKHKTPDLSAYPHYLELMQPIMPSALLENKLHNIHLGAEQLHLLLWQPKEILSFWQVLGEASQQRGYREGRNIIGGKLQQDFGGGLCQLSSILYHLALIANLKIIERHHHSVDIYQESERFTPLGADATVVFGYKDLRLENNLAVPLVLWLQVDGQTLIARLYTEKALNQQAIVFERQYGEAFVTVKALTELGQLVDLSHYALSNHQTSVTAKR